MDYAENLIFTKSASVGIGVGVTKDYGKAQRLYIKRGFKPDGNGLIQNNKSVVFGDTININDDLAFYLLKTGIN